MDGNKIAIEISDKEFRELITEAFDRRVFYSPKRTLISVKATDLKGWRLLFETPEQPTTTQG